MSPKVDSPDARNRRSRVRAPLSLALASALILGALGFLGGGSAAAPQPPGSVAVAAARGQSIVTAAKKKPRASLTSQGTRDSRGRLVVELKSNASKVTVSYTSGKRKRSKTVKLRKGSAIVIVPAGATKATARTKATRKLRASNRILLRATPPPPTPPTPTPSTPPTPAPPRVLRVGLPPIGPASPGTPPPTRWYQAMQTLDCSLINDTAQQFDNIPPGQKAMFASLAQLCLSLTPPGGTVDWAAAASALQQTAGETNCLVLGVRAMLSSAVAAHQADPSAVLVRGDPAPGTACTVLVTDVTGVDLGTSYELTITGQYLFQASGVTVFRLTEVPVGSETLSATEGAADTDVDPPLVPVTASGSGCLKVGAAVNVVVSGPGYQASRVFTPTEPLGDCPP